MGENYKPTVRYDYIDQLKGLSMILVIMGHLILFCDLGDENFLTETIVIEKIIDKSIYLRFFIGR